MRLLTLRAPFLGGPRQLQQQQAAEGIESLHNLRLATGGAGVPEAVERFRQRHTDGAVTDPVLDFFSKSERVQGFGFGSRQATRLCKGHRSGQEPHCSALAEAWWVDNHSRGLGSGQDSGSWPQVGLQLCFPFLRDTARGCETSFILFIS